MTDAQRPAEALWQYDCRYINSLGLLEGLEPLEPPAGWTTAQGPLGAWAIVASDEAGSWSVGRGRNAPVLCHRLLVRQASAGELDASCGCGTTDTVVDEDRCCVRCGFDVILVADRYSHELVEQLRAELDAAKAAEVKP